MQAEKEIEDDAPKEHRLGSRFYNQAGVLAYLALELRSLQLSKRWTWARESLGSGWILWQLGIVLRSAVGHDRYESVVVGRLRLR